MFSIESDDGWGEQFTIVVDRETLQRLGFIALVNDEEGRDTARMVRNAVHDALTAPYPVRPGTPARGEDLPYSEDTNAI